MKVIVISGSVGTGKTTLAKKLAKKLNYKYLDVNKIIKEHKLAESYDKKRKCYVVDVKKLNKVIIDIIKSLEGRQGTVSGIIIDSHLSHYLPKRYVDLCIITKCSLKTLEKRLRKRGYNKAKIRENLDCEIFDVCLNEAKELKHKVLVVDTTRGIEINKLLLISSIK